MPRYKILLTAYTEVSIEAENRDVAIEKAMDSLQYKTGYAWHLTDDWDCEEVDENGQPVSKQHDS